MAAQIDAVETAFDALRFSTAHAALDARDGVTKGLNALRCQLRQAVPEDVPLPVVAEKSVREALRGFRVGVMEAA